MTIEFIRELEGWRGKAALVRANPDEYYVISSIEDRSYGFIAVPRETLAFSADADGHVTNWLQVAGGVSMNRQEVIDELDSWYAALEMDAGGLEPLPQPDTERNLSNE